MLTEGIKLNAFVQCKIATFSLTSEFIAFSFVVLLKTRSFPSGLSDNIVAWVGHILRGLTWRFNITTSDAVAMITRTTRRSHHGFVLKRVRLKLFDVVPICNQRAHVSPIQNHL